MLKRLLILLLLCHFSGLGASEMTKDETNKSATSIPTQKTEQAIKLTNKELKYLDSARRSVVYGQQLVDSGELKRAVAFLAPAALKHKRNDTLISLYAQALYESKDIIAAEKQFMQALRINPLNKVAMAYIEVIRKTEEASVSLSKQQFDEVLRDKIGDIVVFALGFFIGSLMNGLVKRINGWWFSLKSRHTFKRGQYDDFADMLEIQLSTNELKPLRGSLAFLLKSKGLDGSLALLEAYVNTEENLNTLIRMIKLSAKQQCYDNHIPK